MIKTRMVNGKLMQYSDEHKILIDKDGIRYLTAWNDIEVTETDIIFSEDEVLAEEMY